MHQGGGLTDKDTMALSDRIPYLAQVDRPRLRLPGGKKLAVWVILNVEEWRIENAMPRTVLSPPMGQPLLPDVPNWSWHEYGMRAGFWRQFKALTERNFKVTLAINALLATVQPYREKIAEEKRQAAEKARLEAVAKAEAAAAAIRLVPADRSNARNVWSSSHTAKYRGNNMPAMSSGSAPDRSGRSILNSVAVANKSCLLPKYRVTSAASTPTSAAMDRKVVGSNPSVANRRRAADRMSARVWAALRGLCVAILRTLCRPLLTCPRCRPRVLSHRRMTKVVDG